jgi:hypothetical protein
MILPVSTVLCEKTEVSKFRLDRTVVASTEAVDDDPSCLVAYHE